MISEELIREQGGKFGALTYLRERVSGLPIPDYEVRRYDDLGALPVLNSPLTVRSSHPAEFWGMAGLLESVPDVDRGSIRRAVAKIEKSFRDPQLQKYAEQRGIDLGDHFYVGIQEQSRSQYNGSISQYNGSIMRHPNNPDVVYVNFSRGEGTQRENWFIELDSSGKKLEVRSIDDLKNLDKEVSAILDFYKQIEASELMPGYALQVEFGLDPIAIYQARPFKKIETADFELPEANGQKQYRPSYVFGVTDPEGIVLPIVRSYSLYFILSNYREDVLKLADRDFVVQSSIMGMRNIDHLNLDADKLRQTRKDDFTRHIKEHHGDIERDFPAGYALLIDEAHREPYLLDVTVPNMKVFLSTRSANFLTHSVFRQMQNTELSMLGFSGDVRGKVKTGENVRMISNGRGAVLIKE
ncbi:MAG: hypothetical protein HY831_02220 [Candidatus Aenigmarchaeota archaeon]|nr:hypothetical protein [Candidatus Aenigmarchaeota archaeon]